MRKGLPYIAISACAIAVTLGFVIAEQSRVFVPKVFTLSPSEKNKSAAETHKSIFKKIFDYELLENEALNSEEYCIKVWHIEPYWSKSSLLNARFDNKNCHFQFKSYSGVPGDGKWLQNSSAQLSSKQIGKLQRCLEETQFFNSADKAEHYSMGGGEWMIEGKRANTIVRWSKSDQNPEVEALCKNIYRIFDVN